MASETSLGLKSLISMFILALLFFISLLNFGISTAINYGYSESLVNDPKMNLTGIESTLAETTADANKWIESTTKSNLFESFGSLVIVSIWGTANLMINGVTAMFIVLFATFVNVLGLNPIVVATIGMLLLVSLIFAIFRLIRQGE